MRVLSCVLLFVLVAMAREQGPIYELNDAPALFEKFIKDYDRHYKDEADKEVHYKAFLKTLEKINKYNSNQSTATFDINKFADFTEEEMKHLHGFKQNTSVSASPVGLDYTTSRKIAASADSHRSG